jgi:5'-nucleotidase
MKILLTNDDGIQALGLRSLYRALAGAGRDVECIAPISEQSAVGHALTLSSPLRVKEFNGHGFSGRGVSGTPVDCVKLAIGALLDVAPEVVVSGINAGANVGVDVLYSGTVSAATEGALMGLPALAVSYDSFNPPDITEQAEWTARFVSRFDWDSLPEAVVLNLNFPDRPLAETRGLKVCPQTSVAYHDWYEKRVDPRGRDYYWLDGEIPKQKLTPDSDRAMLDAGFITLTPLRFEFTDLPTLEALGKLELD